MDKYIKADDLIDRIYPVDPENDGSDGCTIVMQNLKLSSQEIEAILDEIPAADVVPVVHSSWGKTGLTRQKTICAKCGGERPYKKIKNGYFLVWDSPFCPHCGAKMEDEPTK